MYRIGQVAAQLDISPSILRRWSERFAESLSEQVTNPQKLQDGRYAPITYHDNDLEVLQTIQQIELKPINSANFQVFSSFNSITQ